MKNKAFTDSALLIAITTGCLFTIGYLHEASFLEHFGMNNEEFIPDSFMLIALGFKYVYVKLTNYILSFLVFLLIVALLEPGFREKVEQWFKYRNKNGQLSETITYFKRIFILIFLIYVVLFSVKIISVGRESYDEYVNLTSEDKLDVLYTVSNSKGIEGKVIRSNHGKIAFFNVKTKKAMVFPDSQITKIEYTAIKK